MKTAFKNIQINNLFHTGISHGMGIEKDTLHMTVYQKIDKSHGKVVECKWAPRQLNDIQSFSAYTTVFPLDNLP